VWKFGNCSATHCDYCGHCPRYCHGPWPLCAACKIQVLMDNGIIPVNHLEYDGPGQTAADLGGNEQSAPERPTVTAAGADPNSSHARNPSVGPALRTVEV
jgi:hypothetical protein